MLNKNILFNLLLVNSFIALYVFYIVGFFSVKTYLPLGEIIFQNEFRLEYENYARIYMGISTGIILTLLLYIMRRKIFQIGLSKVFIFLSIFILFNSIVLNLKIQPMLFFGLVLTYFIFEFYLKYSPYLYHKKNLMLHSGTGNFLSLSLSLFLLIPMIVYVYNYLLTGSDYADVLYMSQIYMYDGLRGISLDRVQYSYLVGLSILLIFFRKKDFLFYSLIPLLFVALFLSHTRAPIVTLIIVFLWHYRKNKIALVSVLIMGLVFVLLYINTGAGTGFGDSSRIFIYLHTWDKVFEDGYSTFLFGHGTLYTTTNNGHQPHNLILQSIINFGFLATLIWTYYLKSFFNKLNKYAKTMFLYIMLFGLFHAGFSIFVFIQITLVGYMIILALNTNMDYNNKKKKMEFL